MSDGATGSIDQGNQFLDEGGFSQLIGFEFIVVPRGSTIDKNDDEGWDFITSYRELGMRSQSRHASEFIPISSVKPVDDGVAQTGICFISWRKIDTIFPSAILPSWPLKKQKTLALFKIQLSEL